MPLQLNTPLNVGDLDVAPYDQIRIVRMTHDSVRSRVMLDIEYGRTVDGTWVGGAEPAGKQISFYIVEDDYMALISHMSNEGEYTYAAVKRGLYEWLLNNNYVGAGSIV